MISGRGSGTGKYSYHETSGGRRSVMVAHMPEDGFNVRISFRDNGDTMLPTIKLDERDAELLWASLKRMAVDLQWADKMPGDKE